MCIAILKLIELNRRNAEAIEQQTKTRRLRNENISITVSGTNEAQNLPTTQMTAA